MPQKTKQQLEEELQALRFENASIEREEMQRDIKDLQDFKLEIKVEIAILKTKAATYAAISGLIAGGVISAVMKYALK